MKMNERYIPVQRRAFSRADAQPPRLRKKRGYGCFLKTRMEKMNKILPISFFQLLYYTAFPNRFQPIEQILLFFPWC